LAISKKHKQELVDQYAEWLGRSSAVIFADYRGQPTKSIYDLRAKVRDVQGEFHVVKNTLIIRALREADMPVPEQLLDGPTAMAFCFEEMPAVAKAMVKFAGDAKMFTIKGAILGNKVVDASGVKAVSELPPYPVVMGQVLGTIQAPAGKVAGVVNAALRQIAAVVQARVDQLQAAEGAA